MKKNTRGKIRGAAWADLDGVSAVYLRTERGVAVVRLLEPGFVVGGKRLHHEGDVVYLTGAARLEPDEDAS